MSNFADLKYSLDGDNLALYINNIEQNTYVNTDPKLSLNNDSEYNDDNDYFYDRDDFLNQEYQGGDNNQDSLSFDVLKAAKQLEEEHEQKQQVSNRQLSNEEEQDENFLQVESNIQRSHQFAFSTDDLNRTYPIRKSSCISCALCEANGNGNVARNKDGGFPLRKVASCSICTWDIEEKEFDIALSSSEDSEEVSEEEREEERENEEEEHNESEVLQEENIEFPVRQRSNSYTRAMGEDGLDGMSDVFLNNSSIDIHESNLLRSPPDGGEVTNHVKEIRQEADLFTSSPEVKKVKKKSENKKRVDRKLIFKSQKKQSSFDRKASEELDEIFGKLRQSPNVSFDDDFNEDSFQDEILRHSSEKKSKRNSLKKIIRTPSFMRRNKKSKLDPSKSRSVEHLHTNQNFLIEPVAMKKSVSSMDVSSYWRESDEDEMTKESHMNENWIAYLNNINGTAIFGG